MPDNSVTVPQPRDEGVLDVHPHHALALEKPMEISAPIEEIPSGAKAKSPAAQLAPKLPKLPHNKPLSDLVAPFTLREPARPDVEYVPVRVTVPPMPRPQVFSARPQIAMQPQTLRQPATPPAPPQQAAPQPVSPPVVAVTVPPVTVPTPIQVRIVPPPQPAVVPPAPPLELAPLTSPEAVPVSAPLPVSPAVAVPEPRVEPSHEEVSVLEPQLQPEPAPDASVATTKAVAAPAPVAVPQAATLPSSVMVPAPGELKVSPVMEVEEAEPLKPFHEDATVPEQEMIPSARPGEEIPPPAFQEASEGEDESVPMSAFAGIIQPAKIFSHNTQAVWGVRRLSRMGRIAGSIIIGLVAVLLIVYLIMARTSGVGEIPFVKLLLHQ